MKKLQLIELERKYLQLEIILESRQMALLSNLRNSRVIGSIRLSLRLSRWRNTAANTSVTAVYVPAPLDIVLRNKAMASN